MGFDPATVAIEGTHLLLRLLVVASSLTLHDGVQAWTARRLGDSGQALSDRLTLNPFKHLDLAGLLPIVLMPIGWSRPLPLRTAPWKSPLRPLTWIALSGCATHFCLAILGCLLFAILKPQDGTSGLYLLLLYLVSGNFSLLCLQLLPIFPLDGSIVLFGGLQDPRWLAAKQTMVRWGQVILGIFVFSGVVLNPGPIALWLRMWAPWVQPWLNLFGVPSHFFFASAI